MITKGTIVGENCDNEKYRKEEHERGHPEFVMSRSSLCAFAECPSKWNRGAVSKDTDATEWGSLFDCLVLDTRNVSTRFAVEPEFYENDKGEQKKWSNNANVCKEWKAEQTGQIIDQVTLSEAEQAAFNLYRDEQIVEILTHSRKQVMVTAQWEDPATGLLVPLKALIDIVPNDDCLGEVANSLIDLKTTRNASPSRWVRDVASFHYHVQAALYLAIWNSVPGVKSRKQFRHILVESEAPYQVAKRWLTEDFLEMGKVYCEMALAKYCQCVASGKWPGYAEAIEINGWGACEPTPWMLVNDQRNQ